MNRQQQNIIWQYIYIIYHNYYSNGKSNQWNDICVLNKQKTCMHLLIIYVLIYVQCGRGNTDIPRHSIPWYPMAGAKMRSTKKVHDVPPWFVVRSYCFQCHHRLIWHRFFKAKRRLTVATCKRLFLYVHVSHYIYIYTFGMCLKFSW